MKIFVWVFVALPAFANTYYVSNSGLDSNAGTSAVAPWQSIARINAGSFLPGDSILLERGGVWREQLVPPSSGKMGNPITIAAYGSGVDPVVSGADLISIWNEQPKPSHGAGAGNVWCSVLSNQPEVVFISGALQKQKSSIALLSTPGNWTWLNGNLCVLTSSGTPVQVEASQRDYALLIGQYGGGSYITVSGIDFRLANLDVVHIVNTSGDVISYGLITGGYQFGIFAIGVNGSSVDHLVINSNTVTSNGSSGIEISSGHNNVTVEQNTVFGNAYNGRNTGNFITMAGIYLFSGNPNGTDDLVARNVSHDNGVAGGNESQGAGIWMDTLTSSAMTNNLVFNNVSHGIYIERNIDSVMTNNVAYSNGVALNTANIACYASYGVPAIGNTIRGNISWDSQGWGMKLGAYQGGGVSRFDKNTIENNVVLGSPAVALDVDWGANDDGTHGYGNVYVSNSLGKAALNWVYWSGVGSLSSYDALEAAYGAAVGSAQVNVTDVTNTLVAAGTSPAVMQAILAAVAGL